MSVTTVVKNLWNKIATGRAKTQPETLVQTGVVKHDMIRVPWQRQYSRKAVWEDIDRMDEGDGLIARALDILADFSCCFTGEDTGESPFGFRLQLAESEGDKVSKEEKDAIDILNMTVRRCNLDNASIIDQTWDIFRMMIKSGNHFTEILTDEHDEIFTVQQFPIPWQIEKNTDDRNNIKRGDPEIAMKDPTKADECAYIERNEMGAVVSAFWPYQIVHWAMGPRPGKTYATPLLEPVITQWKRHQAGEDSLAIARITRAWPTRVHKILVPAGASTEEVDKKISDYRTNMEKDIITTYDSSASNMQISYKQNPMDVDTDFYVSSMYTQDGKVIEGGIDVLRGDTGALQNINDIYWSINRILTGIGVPSAYLNIRVGQRSFVDKTPEEGKEAFARTVRRIQMSHSFGLKQILDTQLILAGYNPTKIHYKIIYPHVIERGAEVHTRMIYNSAQAANLWYKMGIPNEIIGKNILELNPEEVEMWSSQVKKQMKPPTDKDTDKDTGNGQALP